MKLDPPALFTTMSTYPSSSMAARCRVRDRVVAGDVGRDDDRLPADRGDRLGGLGQAVRAARDERHVRASVGQRDRDNAADATRGAGHERVLASQVEQAHGQSFHSVGSGQAAGLTRRTISFSTIRT